MHSYEIPTIVDGKAATEIRMIVHASDCEIQQFVLSLAERSRISQEFTCQRVEKVNLSGKLVLSDLVRDNNAELVVTYMAHWAHGFCGIADGLVTEFQLATVSPDANGMFQEAFRLEITRCLSTRGFQKGVKFPARILSD